MDAEGISELYRRFGSLIYRRCRKLLCDPELAEDAAQEVFIRAVRHADRLVMDRECLPWLYRVTTNYCCNVIRDQARAKHVPLSSVGNVVRDNNIERRFTAREEIAELLGEFDGTSAKIAVFAHLDRMTQDEIATVMGLSRRTVGKRLKKIARAAGEFRAARQEA
jgi:RNA polymerase sigma-70 factor (ECF subfamily)